MSVRVTTGQALSEIAENTQQTAITDFTSTTDLTGVDTGTDMTAAQAAQIVADFAALETAVNAIIARLEAAGIIAE